MSSKKYKLPSDVWTQHASKLVIQVIEADGLTDPDFSPYCKVMVGDKVVGKTKKIKKSSNPKVRSPRKHNNFYLNASDIEDSKYLNVEVYSEKKDHFLGEATIAQLQTLQPFDEVIDKWWDLQPKYVMKDKEKERVGGKVHLKLYYSHLPEIKPDTPNVMDSTDLMLDSYFENFIKTGDLILYDGIGVLAAIAKLERSTPFSHVGMVVMMPSKWAGKDEPYVLEVTRNIDGFPDAFSSNPDSGVVIFNLKERLRQFHGSSIWWCPTVQPITKEQQEKMMSWLFPVLQGHKCPPFKAGTKEPSADPVPPSGVDLLVTNPTMMEFAHEHFGIPKKWSNFCETASSDLVVKALVQLGLLSMYPSGRQQSPLWPDEIINLPIFGDPYPLRQKHHSFRIDSLPTGMQQKLVESEKNRLSSEQKEAYNKRHALFEQTGGNPEKLAELGIKVRSTGDKLLLARESTMVFDMSDRNLLTIMVKGARLMRFTHELKSKNLNLSENEDMIICGKHHIDVQDIDEIRTGLKSTNFDRYRKDLTRFENLAFSIMYGRRRKKMEASKSLDFVANTPLEFKIWTVGLELVLSKRDNPEMAIVQRAFRDLKIPRLNLSDTIRLLEKINFKAPHKFVAEKFVEVDTDNSHYLDFGEFIRLLRVLKHRASLTELFLRVASFKPGSAVGDDTLISEEELVMFLVQEQGIHPDKAKIQAPQIIQKFATTSVGQLDALDFEAYILSRQNELFNTTDMESTQPMDRPLTHYFMASSHNTYLVGNQLTGHSSTEQYITVLRNGCRCVELDCWDGDDGNPIIYHGHTLTSKITFENVIIAIHNYAFYASSYPVILSIENHCSHDQQVRMADIMNRVFGERLLLPETRTTTDCLGSLPSPEFLKERIIVKGPMNATVDRRYPKLEIDAQGNPIIALDPALAEAQEDEDEDDSTGGDSNSLNKSGSKSLERSTDSNKPGNLQPGSSTVAGNNLHSSGSSSLQRNLGSANSSSLESLSMLRQDGGLVGTAVGVKIKKPKISDRLSECVSLRTVGFKKFAVNSCQQPWEMSSFAELAALKYSQQQQHEFIKYNINHMSRVYPKGSRFDSSNYDPYPGLSCGSQMVALNWQTMSNPIYYLEGFFARYGRCGYILKPPHLLDYSQQFSTPNLVSGLKITIIDARQLPKKHDSQVGKPRIEVAIVGCKADQASFFTTQAEQGYNPSWNESFTFTITESWSACLVFRLWDRDDENNDVAHYSCMVEAMQSGYRIVPLYLAAHARAPMSNILVHVTKMAAAPDSKANAPLPQFGVPVKTVSTGIAPKGSPKSGHTPPAQQQQPASAQTPPTQQTPVPSKTPPPQNP